MALGQREFEARVTQWHEEAPDIPFRLIYPDLGQQQYDDYQVVLEAVFQPDDLDRARLELWLTPDGYVAVGVETRERVALRLGLRPGWRYKRAFADGFEPREVSIEELGQIHKVLSGGGLRISCGSAFGIVTTIRSNLWPNQIGFGSRMTLAMSFRKNIISYKPW